MAAVVWRDEAKADVLDILEFIAQHNAPAAERYVVGLRSTGEDLRLFPKRGRVFKGDIRMLVYRHHLILYRHSKDMAKVTIQRVLDSRRDPDALLLDLDDPH